MTSANTISVSRESRRINVRLIAFLSMVCAPFVWILYMFLSSTLTGGIEQRAGYAAVDLKSLGEFPFDAVNGQVRDVPSQWRALDGKRVLLDGFMYSRDNAIEVSRFEFVYNINICCFNAPPKVQERVFCNMPGNTPVPYDSKTECKVTGILHVVAPYNEAAQSVLSVYTLDVEKVERQANNLPMAMVVGIGIVATAAIGAIAISGRGR